jgi:hypothetical protein
MIPDVSDRLATVFERRRNGGGRDAEPLRHAGKDRFGPLRKYLEAALLRRHHPYRLQRLNVRRPFPDAQHLRVTEQLAATDLEQINAASCGVDSLRPRSGGNQRAPLLLSGST